MVGKYQAYPEYKNSGYSLLGLIPSRWIISKVRYLTECLDGKRIPLNATERGEMPGPYPYWGANGVVDYVGEWLFDEDLVLIGEDGAPFFESNKDVAFNVSGKVWVNNHAHILRPNSRKICSIFLKYALNRVDFHLYINGSTRDKLTQADMNAIALRLPPLEEQRTIAAFLDHETARIDRLIEKQQRLIELLKEKRQAVISHAVTKGLDPNVPMKDSGVEWLGQVPAHWAVTRAKMVSEIFVPQRNKPELNDSGDGLHWATMEDMKSDAIDETRKYVSQEAVEAAGSKVLKKGAVVASCVGNFGIASVLNIDVVINQQLQAYIPKAISGPYLRDVITCSKVYFDLVGTAATLVYVNQEGFGNLPIPLPPMVEQREIERHIDLSKAKLDRAIAKGQQQVSLLQERRTALISAAVTGKIDVRNWQLNTSTQTAEPDLPMAAEQAAEYRV